MLTLEIPRLELVKIQVANEVKVDLHGTDFLGKVVAHQFFVCGVEPKSYWNSGS